MVKNSDTAYGKARRSLVVWLVIDAAPGERPQIPACGTVCPPINASEVMWEPDATSASTMRCREKAKGGFR
jgi:hypothetical protein